MCWLKYGCDRWYINWMYRLSTKVQFVQYFRDIYLFQTFLPGETRFYYCEWSLQGGHTIHKDSSRREMFAKRNEKSSERVALSSWRQKKKKGKDGDPPLPSNRIVTELLRSRTVKLLVTQSVCKEHLTKKRADFRVTPRRHVSITETDLLRNSIASFENEISTRGREICPSSLKSTLLPIPL